MATMTTVGNVRPARLRRSDSQRNLTRGSALGLGVMMLWFSLLVLIPLTAVVATAGEQGPGAFIDALTNPQTLSALRLTVLSSLGVTAVNLVMGTVIAWVLVRDRFPGKGLVDLVIDIPFAMPTIVAGLVLLSLYGPESPLGVEVNNTRKAVFLALAFVTVPFVVRTVQPVLAEMDTDVEDAAASLGGLAGHHVPPDRLADAGARGLRRGDAVLRPRDQRVRLAGAAERQPAPPHGGRFGPGLQRDRGWRPAVGGRRRDDPAAGGAGRDRGLRLVQRRLVRRG